MNDFVCFLNISIFVYAFYVFNVFLFVLFFMLHSYANSNDKNIFDENDKNIFDVNELNTTHFGDINDAHEYIFKKYSLRLNLSTAFNSINNVTIYGNNLLVVKYLLKYLHVEFIAVLVRHNDFTEEIIISNSGNMNLLSLLTLLHANVFSINTAIKNATVKSNVNEIFSTTYKYFHEMVEIEQCLVSIESIKNMSEENIKIPNYVHNIQLSISKTIRMIKSTKTLILLTNTHHNTIITNKYDKHNAYINNTQLYMTYITMLLLPIQIISGLFGMNVRVPWEHKNTLVHFYMLTFSTPIIYFIIWLTKFMVGNLINKY